MKLTKRFNKPLITTIIASALVTACATPPKIATVKTYQHKGETLKFGGSYYPDNNKLILTINNDPVMQGQFPPFTPTQNFRTKYSEIPITANCYFGSVLSSKGGAFGVVASVIQSKKGVSGDKCKISVDSKLVDTLYF